MLRRLWGVAGIVSNTATAATAIPGPHQPVAAGVAATATRVDFVRKLVEQGLSPGAGKAISEIFTLYLGDLATNRAPLVAPVSNELLKVWKKSESNKSFTEWSDDLWKQFIQRIQGSEKP